jgi:hypothetical protein
MRDMAHMVPYRRKYIRIVCVCVYSAFVCVCYVCVCVRAHGS